MKGWQLNGPCDLSPVKRTDEADFSKEVKVRITKVMLTKDDVALFNGDDKCNYPIIPGRSAIGLIVEVGENPYGYDKNMRVYLEPITNCKRCYSCTIGQPKDCANFRIAGRNEDGFLKDFAIIPFDNIYQLPKSVSDTEALFIEYISLAASVIDKLQIQKGEHVAVIGGNVLGNIIAQLIIYYQAVPIIIDDNESYLETAKRSGIYYTLKADVRLEKEISELTGGRMTPKVVYVANCGINTEAALRISRANAIVAFAGFSYSNIRVNFIQAMQKQLHFYCIANGYGNTETSINLIANRAINMNNFNIQNSPLREVSSVLRKGDELIKTEQEVPNIVLDMLN